MKVNALVRSITGALLFGLGVATGLLAQTSSDLPQRVEQKRADLSGAPDMEVIASVTELKPGDFVGLHSHHGVEAVYVLQGGTVQVPGKDPAPLPTGATLFNLRDVKHSGFKVVGDTSVKLFSVHVVDKGKPLFEYVQ